MKTLLLTLFIFSISVTSALTPLAAYKPQQEYSDCVKKYKAEWGRTCSACKQEGNTYTVFLRNECNQAVDVKCAVQEIEKKWRTFTRLNLNPKDSMSAYACNGAGKYLYWVRKAGDKTISFPTDEVINTQYNK